MAKAFPSITADQIDANSEKLLAEWRAHFESVSQDLLREHPDLIEAEGGIDKSRLFEGWIVQKVSSLQLLVIQLVGEVERLRDLRP